jgi:anaerobic selenocysteine-containing dehydrogenase
MWTAAPKTKIYWNLGQQQTTGVYSAFTVTVICTLLGNVKARECA